MVVSDRALRWLPVRWRREFAKHSAEQAEGASRLPRNTGRCAQASK